MKKNYFLKTFLALLITTNVLAQNVPSYVPKNGLVGWWPFNGNANDESGNGNNGDVNGANLTTDRNGVINSAYSFNGISNYIFFPQLFEFHKNNNSTISFWVKCNELINNYQSSILYSKNSSGDYNRFNFYLRSINSNTNYKFSLDYRENQSDVNTNMHELNSTDNFKNGTWQNITITREADTYKLYLNNVLESSINDKSVYLPISTGWIIGEDPTSDSDFKGFIDDIVIYNRTLNQQEITALYTSKPPCTKPIAVITPQGNATFCQGGFVNLNATEGANYSYEWFNNSQLIAGATQSVYQASTNGFYTVKVKDGACSATSNSVPVTVTQYPSSDVSVSGPTTFCEGGSVTLTALGNGSYKWNNGVTSKSITVNKSGIYRVEVTNNNCTSSSKDYSITVNPNPIAKITPDGPTAFCEGGAVNLVASGGTNYKWNSGILTPSITVTKTGTYYVNVINSFGCSVNKSYDVNVYPNPTVSITPIAQFTLQNNSSIKLSATPAGGTFKGEGVTGTSFNPSNIGLGKKTIYYNYTSTQGCSGSAKLQTIVVDSIGTKCTSYDTITVTNTINDTVGILKIKFQLTTGIKANQFTSVSVYPNPTSDVLIIDASDVQALNGYRYKMIDALGKTVYNELVIATKTEISLKTFGKAGVYILHVVDANNTSIETRQIVLE